jgi:hypothetical protein
MGIRGGMLVNGKAKESEIRAVVTRADGTVEDLGVIAYWHRNPLRRWAWGLNHWLKGVVS